MFVYKYYEVWTREEIDERQHQEKNKREREYNTEKDMDVCMYAKYLLMKVMNFCLK